MFKSIWDDIKKRFLYGDTVTQLVLINVIAWAAIVIIGFVILTPIRGIGTPNLLVEWLAVPADGMKLLVRPWTVITYMFTHEGFMHILFNMLILYWFGQILVNYLGNHRVIPIYVLGGLMGFLFYFFSYNLLPANFSNFIGSPMLGASAGVMAVVMAAAAIAPTHTLHLMFIGPIQIRYIAIGLILLDMIAIQNGSNTGGHLAHLGGVVLGYTFIEQLKRGNDWSVGFNRSFDKIKDFFYNNFSRKNTSTPKETKKKGPRMAFKNEEKVNKRTQNSGSTRRTTSSNQEAIDAILDKIKESGYDSLTKEEKEFLFKVSKEK
ncbi:MAG: rhomboid family intramembrane serine protease [Saprospiraceae bacterium]